MNRVASCESFSRPLRSRCDWKFFILHFCWITGVFRFGKLVWEDGAKEKALLQLDVDYGLLFLGRIARTVHCCCDSKAGIISKWWTKRSKKMLRKSWKLLVVRERIPAMWIIKLITRGSTCTEKSHESADWIRFRCVACRMCVRAIWAHNYHAMTNWLAV